MSANQIIRNALEGDGIAKCEDGEITSSELRKLLCGDKRPKNNRPLIMSSLNVVKDEGWKRGTLSDMSAWSLDLSYSHVSYGLEFHNCTFKDGIKLYNSHLNAISFSGCTIECSKEWAGDGGPYAIFAQMLVIDSDLLFVVYEGNSSGKIVKKKNKILGTVEMNGACINGRFYCNGLDLGNENNSIMFNARDCRIGITLGFFDVNLFGSILLQHADVAGSLTIELDSDKVLSEGEGHPAINLSNARVGKAFVLGRIPRKDTEGDICDISGGVVLNGAEFRTINIFRCVIKANNRDVAINACGITVHGDMRFNGKRYSEDKKGETYEGAICHGRINLNGSIIKGELDFNRAEVNLPSDTNFDETPNKSLLQRTYISVKTFVYKFKLCICKLFYRVDKKESGGVRINCSHTDVGRLLLNTKLPAGSVDADEFYYKSFSDPVNGDDISANWIEDNGETVSVPKIRFANVIGNNGKKDNRRSIILDSIIPGKVLGWFHRAVLKEIFWLKPNALAFCLVCVFLFGWLTFGCAINSGYLVGDTKKPYQQLDPYIDSALFSAKKLIPFIRPTIQTLYFNPESSPSDVIWVKVYTFFHAILGTLFIGLYIAKIIRDVRQKPTSR